MSQPTITFDKAMQEIKAISKLAELTGFISASNLSHTGGDSFILADSLETHTKGEAIGALTDSSFHLVTAYSAFLQFFSGVDIISHKLYDGVDNNFFDIIKEKIEDRTEAIIREMAKQGNKLSPRAIEKMREMTSILLSE